MTRAGYEAYITYLACQRHFSTDYDFFKYNGKVNASTSAYEKRNDMYSFEKLTKIVPKKEEQLKFFIAHFLENPKEWIRNMSKTKYEWYKADLRKLPQKFKEDCLYIKQSGPARMMEVQPKQVPLIHQKAIEKDISLETLCLIDQLVYPFLDNHEKNVSVPFMFPQHLACVKNYKPFLMTFLDDDKEKFQDIAKETFLQ